MRAKRVNVFCSQWLKCQAGKCWLSMELGKARVPNKGHDKTTSFSLDSKLKQSVNTICQQVQTVIFQLLYPALYLRLPIN